MTMWFCGWVWQKLLQSQPAGVENFDNARTPKETTVVSRILTLPARLLVCPSTFSVDNGIMQMKSVRRVYECVCVGVCVQRDSLYNLFTDCHQFWVKLRISSQMSNWLTDERLTWPSQHAAKIDDATRLCVCVCVFLIRLSLFSQAGFFLSSFAICVAQKRMEEIYRSKSRR